MFTITTGAMRLVWRPRKETVHALGEDAPATVPPVRTLAPGVTPLVEASGPAVLREQTDYVFFLEGRGGRSVAVRHRDPVVLRGLQATGGVVHGVVNFGAQLGRSRFVVEVDGTPHLAFEVEVGATKLDYRADYEAIRADLWEVAAGLVLAYMQATYRPGRAHLSAAGGVAEWVQGLQHYVGELEEALAYVARHPLQGIERQEAPVRAARLTRPDAVVRRAVVRGRGRGAGVSLAGKGLVREQLPAGRLRPTSDTSEHRWIAMRVASVRRRLGRLTASMEGRGGLRHAAAVAALQGLGERVARLERREPLASARQDASEPVREPSLRLLTAPGYREAARACLAMEQGVAFEEGPLALGLKDLHLLYEYWCFLTLVRETAKVLEVPAAASGLLAVEQRGVHLRLVRGRRQTVRLRGRGRAITIIYNPRFTGAGYLVPQQPDLVLTVRDAARVSRYVLDAKYRLDASPAYRRRYGVPGPPAEALNDLHRYRDAIREPAPAGKAVRSVVQALALYPYREERPGLYAASRHARALSEVGIGAIPLLPGATEHLAGWLESLLS